MPSSIVAVPQFTPETPVRTVDGELWSDTSGPAPYGPLLQVLVDRVTYARGALWGQLTWSGAFGVDAGGAPSSFAVRVGIIEAVTLRDASNVWRPYFTSAETVLGLAHVDGAPASLTADAHYYVYAWADAGAPGAVKFQISLDPPTESAAPSVLTGYKRGQSANFRYLGHFRTDGSGAPLPVRAARGRYTYDRGGIPETTLQVVTGSPTAWTAVSLADLVPPHARVAALRVIATGGGTPGIAGAVEVQSYGSSASGTHSAFSPSAAGYSNAVTYDVPCDTSQRVQYRVVGGSAAPSATLAVLGFSE